MGSYALPYTQLLKYIPTLLQMKASPSFLLCYFSIKILKWISIAFTIKSGGLIIASEPANLFNLIKASLSPVFLLSSLQVTCSCSSLPVLFPSSLRS